MHRGSGCRCVFSILATLIVMASPALAGSYVNFEVSHVHPIDLTPSGDRLLAVNTPDSLLEVFEVLPNGQLAPERAIPVGLEPVTVVARTKDEAWVVSDLSDAVHIVDLTKGVVVRTLHVGDEPTDVAFAGSRAFVTVSQEDAVKVFDLSNLDATPAIVPLFSRAPRALAVSNDGKTVYAVALHSGNQTTSISRNVIPTGLDPALDPARLAALGLSDLSCAGAPPPYPPLPDGIERNPALIDPANGVPPVSLIVRWDDKTRRYVDDAGQDWTHCVGFELPDHDLFAIDVATLAVNEIDHLGTTLFDVSVHPANGRIYVPNTDARNFVRFEHELGLKGHVVDNRLSVVDFAKSGAATIIDLNAHIDRSADAAGGSSKRAASVSQPGMLVWAADGSRGFMTAIGSRKVFEVSGSCMAPSCIFGSNRSKPRAVEVGDGPTGVALNEAAQRLYVLNRVSHSISVVDTAKLKTIDEIPLHDPSPEATRTGRKFLYDAMGSSAHGDAACSSCHISGDTDMLAWDLGNPEGEMVRYSEEMDNVRFVQLGRDGTSLVDCDPATSRGLCANHEGFDPQKGPMTTQTLRGLLEPLHWRGDKATMNEFNAAFVGLLGKGDLNKDGGKPKGLSDREMERFRQFALGINFPPNPYRELDDTLPCSDASAGSSCAVQQNGMLFPGDPAAGELVYNRSCAFCHLPPFGAAGGKLGGVEPQEPVSDDAAALINGLIAIEFHSDFKVPHVRGMYEKFGPAYDSPGSTRPEAKNGFGYEHDGSFPDLYRFLAIAPFDISPANGGKETKDLAAFLFHFPTGTKPSIGTAVTLPAGSPPTGSSADEAALTTLIALGDTADAGRHCDLVASTIIDGRSRSYHLAAGVWSPDAAGDDPLATTALRENAAAPITFRCGTVGSGPRLGGNRDEDPMLDGDDCAAGDAGSWGMPAAVTDLRALEGGVARFGWSDQSAAAGSGVRYDVIGGALSDMQASGVAASSCVADDLDEPEYEDTASSAPGGGSFYLVRAKNGCGQGSLGEGRDAAQASDCE